MKQKFVIWVVHHPAILKIGYIALRFIVQFISLFVPKKKKVLITSYGGRKYDDSPYAIYQRMLLCPEFVDYDFVWAFVDPDAFDVGRARKVRIDSLKFFYELLSATVWISNSGIDRGIGLSRKNRVSVETWHGFTLKRICGEEARGNVLNENLLRKCDKKTIRCAQSEFDMKIFSRVFNADEQCFLLSDLPRNDELLDFSGDEVRKIKEELGLPEGKKVILYMPTYREYWIDDQSNIFMRSLIDINKWKDKLSDNYILLVRAHYAVSKALLIIDDDFCKDVSGYQNVNSLYKVADIFISDYSSAFVDFSILERPMLCYANDYEEYEKQRGLYFDLHDILPCPVDEDEDALISRILTLDYNEYSERTKEFHMKFSPLAGHATVAVVEEIIKQIREL